MRDKAVEIVINLELNGDWEGLLSMKVALFFLSILVFLFSFLYWKTRDENDRLREELVKCLK